MTDAAGAVVVEREDSLMDAVYAFTERGNARSVQLWISLCLTKVFYFQAF